MRGHAALAGPWLAWRWGEGRAMSGTGTDRPSRHAGLDELLDDAARLARGPAPREALRRTWARRAVTIPAMVAATGLYLVLLPVVLPLAAVYDLLERRDLVTVRCLVAVLANLIMHCVAVLLLLGIWLLSGCGGAAEARERRWTVWLENWWTCGAWRTAEVLFRMRTEVEGGEALEQPGPLIVFPRHASILDTMLPFYTVAAPTQRRLRHVMKHELLVDPAVDVIGHRVPTAFVRRGTRSHAAQVAAVERLVDGLEDVDAVIVYPEGTRFTEEKRRRVLARIAEKDPESYARARSLRHVLPPHVGGPLGILERDARADVVFCAHTGLEGANHLSDLFGGCLFDRTVQVRFWRVPASDIPEGRDERVEWLYDWWERVDRWVDAHEVSRASR